MCVGDALFDGTVGLLKNLHQLFVERKKIVGALIAGEAFARLRSGGGGCFFL